MTNNLARVVAKDTLCCFVKNGNDPLAIDNYQSIRECAEDCLITGYRVTNNLFILFLGSDIMKISNNTVGIAIDE